MAAMEDRGPQLPKLDRTARHEFVRPAKRIHDGDDVGIFLTSRAYRDITNFLFQLNAAMMPHRSSPSAEAINWDLDSNDVSFSPTIIKLRALVERLGSFIDEAPPDTGPRRFGNISFRKWHELAQARCSDLLDDALPVEIGQFDQQKTTDVSPKQELEAYLLGSFGSAQRLDYGTGHELSFLAFLGGIWKLGGFTVAEPGVEERAIVLGIIEPYLQLVRRLILTYTLEPAGSHGVWGLDDHSFLPYILGSAQLSPPINYVADIKTEGSREGAPEPGDVAKKAAVTRERGRNMYFSAIGFIYDVKKGPFWEHSPILFDISGVKAGWAKINKGMLKMYNAEVLSKFPVVQHFPFGSLFIWEKDPLAIAPPITAHRAGQPARPPPPTSMAPPGPGVSGGEPATRAPWAANPGRHTASGPSTAAPWASRPLGRPPPPTGAPSASSGERQPPHS